jgi:biotin carboxylase
MRKVLIVTASRQQLPLIRRAKELGLKVVATDRDPNAVGFSSADVAEVVETLNWEAVLEVACRHQVSAVLTEQTDVAVPTVARVADAMGLPGIGADVALAASNKFQMRSRCLAAGLPMPQFRMCGNIEEAERAARDIGFPVIVKPTDSQASRGVTKVFVAARLEAAVTSAMAHSHSGTVMIEELMLGVESSVEAFVDGDHITTLAICDKTKCAPPYSYDIRLVYPGRFSRGTLDELQRTNEEVIRAVGIRMGITHGEYIVTERGVRLIEVAARGCGARVATDLLPAMTGADILGARILQVLGEPAPLEVRRHLAGVLDFIVLPPGRATHIDGLDAANAVPGVVGVELAVREGQSWGDVRSADGRHGYILAVGETVEAAMQAVSAARARLQIELAPDA